MVKSLNIVVFRVLSIRNILLFIYYYLDTILKKKFLFLCNFDIRWYPFDIQRCYLLLDVKRSYSPFIKLLVENYEYSGEKYLTQYEVVDMVMMSTNNSKNVQEIFVEILFGRELLEVILNIISPTMTLNLISYTTNFYREEYFETVLFILQFS